MGGNLSSQKLRGVGKKEKEERIQHTWLVIMDLINLHLSLFLYIPLFPLCQQSGVSP